MVAGVTLFKRLAGTKSWARTPMSCVGRRTYVVQLGPFNGASETAEYYVEADLAPSKKLAAPLEAPSQTYTLTLL
jgi:hypothetical protein